MESEAKESALPALADQRLAQVLKHPLRARIMAEQEGRKRSLPELAEALEESPRRVGYHWRVLRSAGGLRGD
jgi:DNA-binding transcriptional ArsR family regulator